MIKFVKYSAAGNDFILLSEKDGNAIREKLDLARLCHRRFGIGADGIIFYKTDPLTMIYYNSDGGEAEMCGNGLRAVTDYFYRSNFISPNTEAKVLTQKHSYDVQVSDESCWIKMNDITEVGEIDITNLYKNKSSLYINTGVPHSVFEVGDLEVQNFVDLASKIRHDQRFKNGSNVDFYRGKSKGLIEMRVFERGVEDETYSSGTGVSAVAMSYFKNNPDLESVKIETRGGEFSAKRLGAKLEDGLLLTGPLGLTFEGSFAEEEFLK
ncbi:MAG: diaminopimelate epimerase [Bacteriovoracaceae bacterium]